ncbi:MAG: F420-non-reducing hydrogenase iron-sulfur subunit [Thermodesulfobacteriota bacterium]|nr:F420-non-reducing hydrogenase iron-sulfur subunit [Thermodesulfobacteriota bacterium]
MCSGRVDMAHVFRAFSKGVDGVFLGACHLNECNYITHGNYHALTMVNLAKKLLEHIGLNPERLKIEFMSGSESNLFVEGVNGFVKKVKELGPLGRGEGMDEKELKFKLESVIQLIPYIRLVERERLRLPAMPEEEYRKFFDSDELNRLFEETVADKLAIAQIVSLLRDGPLSTAEIAKTLSLTPSKVSKYLNASSKQRLVRYDESQKRFALA